MQLGHDTRIVQIEGRAEVAGALVTADERALVTVAEAELTRAGRPAVVVESEGAPTVGCRSLVEVAPAGAEGDDLARRFDDAAAVDPADE